MDLSAREQMAIDRASGREVYASYQTLARGRADLRRRYGDAPTFAEALRRHQMATDEEKGRIDALERRFETLNQTIERALSRGNGSSAEVERQVRRIEDDFSPDELKMVRDHREYEAFKRNVERYGAELEREAALALASKPTDDDDDDDGDADDDVDDEDDDDEDAASKDAPGKTKNKAKPKPKKEKPKPPARHPKPDDKPDEDEKPTGLLQRLMSD